MTYALLNTDGTIQSTFVQPQPLVHGCVQIGDDDPRLIAFRAIDTRRAAMRAAFVACDTLRKSIIVDDLFLIFSRAAAQPNAPAELQPYAQMARAVLTAEIDIAYAYVKFTETADEARLQDALNAIADTCGRPHVILRSR